MCHCIVPIWQGGAGATNMQAALAVIGTMEPSTKMCEVQCDVDEVALMAELLSQNATHLDGHFKRSVAKHENVLSVSVLTSIPFSLEQEHYKLLGNYCHRHGTLGCRVLRCSKFKNVAYCS